jgi:predicted dehydrogenase
VLGSYLQDWLPYETDTSWRSLSASNGRSRVFADIGSHWCDLAEWITGHKITEVVAVTAAARWGYSPHSSSLPPGHAGGLVEGKSASELRLVPVP